MIRFAVVSDIHAEQHPDWSRLVLERMAARKLDFVAFLGDICTSPSDCWWRHFAPLQRLIRAPVFACRGNHDEPDRWRKWWGLPDDFVRTFPDVRCVFWDSNDWRADGPKSDWLRDSFDGPERFKFAFTHLTPRIGHWGYGLGPQRTKVLTTACAEYGVTASFTGHMHGFDYLRQGETQFFICGGGGGGRHDNFPVFDRSNFYVLVECGDSLEISVCRQHRSHEQVVPMSHWINETRRPAPWGNA